MKEPFKGLLRLRVFGRPVRDRVPHIRESTGIYIIMFGRRRKHVVLRKYRRANLFWLSFTITRTHRIIALGGYRTASNFCLFNMVEDVL